MTALWGHLQPEPYNNQISQTALRILGKLGGQNRKLLKDPPSLSYKAFADGGLEASIVFKPFEEMPKVLSLNFALDTVLEVFKESKVDEFYLNKALDFLKGSLSLLFDVDPGAENLHSIFGQQIDMYMNRRKSKNSMEIDDAASNSSSGIPPSPFLDLPPVTQYKLDSHTVAINKVLVSLFYASRNQSLKEECTLLIENICRHFALMSVAAFVSGDPNGSITSSSKQPQLPPRNASSTFTKPPITLDVLLSTPATRLDGFVDAIVEVMSCDINELRNLAQSSLEIFYNTSVSFLSESDVVEDMPIFRAFASKFSASCYQPEWFRKNGGCSGIALLSGKISLSANWLLEYELEFVRALLYVLKDTSSEMTSGNVDDATKTLYHILRICNTAPSPTTAASESAILAPQQDRTSKFNSLIALLISELSSSNSFVRETIQESFSILASLTNVEVTELLSPVRDRLLTPIFAKPLRALPIPMQIGHIDAITYCLSLRPSLLSFSDELLRLLHESLALADADDQALIIGKPSQYKNATLLINLRVVCIKLLSAAMTNNEFSNPKLTSTRGRIIAMFFKSLYTKSSEVVDVAYKGKFFFEEVAATGQNFINRMEFYFFLFVGLQQVLNAQHKLPKDLLQAGLRPILVNLSDHTRLSVSGLEGLARLLELLTNYFKVEIGRKLLDHMKQWALPAMLEDAACKPLSEIEEIKLIVGIVNVFHLLPAAANVFMEELVEQVLDLENRLRRYRSSPFRQPLIKFLNIYATEAVEQFYKKISTSSPHNRLFVGILGSPEATKLRQEIVKAPSSYFIAATFGAGDEDNKFELQLQGVLMMKEICKFQPEFLLDNADLLYHLRLIWKQELPLQKDNLISSQSKQVLLQSILDLFIMYCNIQSDEIDLLFDMVSLYFR